MQETITHKAGSFIYVEGDEDIEHIYIIKTGKVEQQSSIKELKGVQQISGAGDTIGFISSLANRPRMVSAKALTDSTLIKISKNSFLSLVQKNPEIGFKMLNFYASQLRHFNNLVLSEKMLRQGFYDLKLYSLAKKFFELKQHNNSLYALNSCISEYPDSEFSAQAIKIKKQIEDKFKISFEKKPCDDMTREFGPGEIIFCEYEQGNELYIIKEGKVKIVRHTKDNSEVILSLLEKDDIFGELAIISDKPRNATAISHDKTKLISVNKDSLEVLLHRSPDLIYRIFTSISQRVWFTIIRLESYIYHKPLTRIYTFLENKLLEENVSLKSGEPFTFNFGIDELLKMIDLKQEEILEEIETVLKDPSISFNFGQITIEDPREISAHAKMYKNQDRIISDKEKKKISKSLKERITEIQ